MQIKGNSQQLHSLSFWLVIHTQLVKFATISSKHNKTILIYKVGSYKQSWYRPKVVPLRWTLSVISLNWAQAQINYKYAIRFSKLLHSHRWWYMCNIHICIHASWIPNSPVLFILSCNSACQQQIRTYYLLTTLLTNVEI